MIAVNGYKSGANKRHFLEISKFHTIFQNMCPKTHACHTKRSGLMKSPPPLD